ncbi:MAG: hypothetical protein IKJ35_06090 [Clostridia bacterium]|nr:hypothetical protein [Clostridia bacterium]
MHATNLTELIRDGDLCGLLRLCGTKEALLSHGSDYDFFLAVCRSLPLLKGHPFPESLQIFLKTRFGIAQPITIDHAAEIWRAVADALLMQPTAFPVKLALQKPAETRLPPLQPQANAVLWRVDGKIDTVATSWEAWVRELREMLDEKERAGFSCISLHLSDAALAQKPNPYRVDLSLQATPRKNEDTALLASQRLRFFCIEAQRRELTLILHLDADCQNPIGCLEWLEKTVGLPSLLLVVTQETCATFLPFAMRVHRAPVGLALDSTRYPSRAEFEKEAIALAACYPLGRLSVVDGERLSSFGL